MSDKINIDIIILSYAKDEALKDLTIQTIETLLASEDPEQVIFNVIVIESNRTVKPYQYKNSTTIYPNEKFGFHRYLNIGIKQGNSSYVCLCNNDLVFHKNWATKILKAMDEDPKLLSTHPTLPGFKKPDGFTGHDSELDSYFGVLFGWCIFIKREIFDVIGLLDENLTFWYADYDYAYTLKKYNITNRLIPTSIVEHLGSRSWVTMDKKEHQKLTQIPRLYFSYKWHHGSYIRYKLELFYHQTKLLFSSDK